MAYWAKGMHELSLGHAAVAVDSFAASYDYALQDTREQEASTDIGPEGSFAVLLGAGYLGLARWVNGDPAGRELYEQAAAAFQAQLDDAEKKGDAGFGLAQLEKVRERYGPGAAESATQ